MEQTAFEKFRQLLIGHAPQLQEVKDQNIMIYYQYLEENNDIDAFDSFLRKQVNIELKSQIKIYGQLVKQNIFKNLQKEIFVTWLTFFILYELKLKKIDIKQYQVPIKDVIEKVKKDHRPKDLIESLVDFLVTQTKANLKQEREENIMKNIKKQSAYLQYKNSLHLEPKIKQNNEQRKEDINNPLFQEKLKSIKKDLSNYGQGTLEYSIQDALLEAFQLHHNLKTDDGSIDAKISRIRQLYESQKEFIIFEYKDKMLECIQHMESNKDNIGKVLEDLKQLKKSILVIDYFQLERLIKNAQKTKQQIKGKSIILILGNTGSGKSTNILKMLGNNFKKIDVEGATFYVPDDKLKPEHRSFHTSFYGISCTSFINAARIPENMKEKMPKKAKNNDIYVCDPPGFRDTRGCQNDISNQYGTLNALYCVRNMRVVVLFSNDELVSQRSSCVRDMAGMINSLCPDWDQIEDSLEIYINQKQKIDRKKIEFCIRDLLDKKKENSITNNELHFIEKLKDCCSQTDNYVNPIKQSTDKFKLKLANLIKLQAIPRKVIQQNFKYSFSTDSKDRIDRYLSQCKSNFKNLFSQDRYQRAQIYFNRLAMFIQLLSNDQLENEEGQQDEVSKHTEEQEESEGQEEENESEGNQSDNNDEKDENNKRGKKQFRQRRNISLEHLNQMKKFLLQEVQNMRKNLEKNLKIIVQVEKNNQFYQMARKNIQNLRKIGQIYHKHISDLKVDDKIDQLISVYGQQVKQLIFREKTSIEQSEQAAKRMVQYSQCFSCFALMNQMIFSKAAICSREISQYKCEVEAQNYNIQKSKIQETQKTCRVITILKGNKSDKTSLLEKLNQVKIKADSKFNSHVQSTTNLLKNKINSITISLILNNIEKIQALLQNNLLTDIDNKIAKQEEMTKQIRNHYQQKLNQMSQFFRNNIFRILQKESINDIKSINQQIVYLLHIPSISSKYSSKYQNFVNNLRQRCSIAIEDFDEQLETIKQNIGRDIGKFQSHIKKMKRNIQNLLKYSPIISKNEDQAISPIKKCVSAVQSIFQSELKFIQSLDITQLTVDTQISTIENTGREIFVLSKLLFGDDNFQPLRNKMKEIQEIFDEKVSYPLKQVNQSLTQALGHCMSPVKKKPEDSMQEPVQLQHKKILSYVKGNIETFEIIIAYVMKIKSMSAFSQCKQFKQQCTLLKKSIQKAFIQTTKNCQATFIESQDPQVTEDIYQSVQCLGLIENKKTMSKYFQQLKYNPREQKNILNQKLTAICQKYDKKIENKKGQDFIKLSEKVSKYKRLFKAINNKDMQESQLQPSFNSIYDKIKAKVNDRVKQKEQQIESIFKEKDQMKDIFEELSPIFEDLNQLKFNQDKLLLDNIFGSLYKSAGSINNKIKDLEKKIKSKGNLSPRSSKVSSTIISDYVKHCESILYFHNEINKQKSLISQKQKYKSSKYENCLGKIKPQRIQQIYKQLNETFSSRIGKILTDLDQMNLQKIYPELPIITKIENCFEIQDKLQQLKGVQYFKEQFFKIASNKLSKKEYQNIKKACQNGGISCIVSTVVAHFEEYVYQKYQNRNNFMVDKNFASYYYHQTQDKQTRMIELFGQYMRNQLEKYRKSEGNYEDAQFTNINTLISYLPEKFRSIYEDKLIQNKQQYQQQIKKSKRDYIDNIHNKPDLLKELLRKLGKSSTKTRPICVEILKECLDKLMTTLSDVDSRVKILKYYQIAHDQPSLKNDKQATEIFKKSYKQNLIYLQNEMDSIFKKIRKDIDKSIPFSEKYKTENTKNIQSTFKIFQTTKYKGKLFFCDRKYEAQIEKDWQKNMIDIVSSLKNQMNQQTVQTFMSAQNCELEKYFNQLKKSSFTIQTIHEEYSNMQAGLKNNLSKQNDQRVPRLQSQLPSKQSEESILDNFRKQVQRQFQTISKFELITPQRYNETIQQTTSDLEKMNKMLINYEDKLDIINQYVLKSANNNSRQKYEKAKQRISQKYQTLVDQTLNEIQLSFSDYNREPAKIINIFLKISKGHKQASCNIINIEKLNQETIRITSQIRRKFSQLDRSIKNSLKDAEKEYQRIEKQQEKSESSFQQLKSNLLKQKQKEISTLTKDLDEQFKEQIENCSSEQEKENITNKLQSQKINSINMIEGSFEEKQLKLEEEREKENKKITKETQGISKKFCELLIIFKKNLIQIDQFDSTNENLFKANMKNLQDKNDNFIYSMIVGFKSIQDPHSYGIKILKEDEAFKSYQQLERQDLTKSQDINYVIENLQYLNQEQLGKKFKQKNQKQIKNTFENFNKCFSDQVKAYMKNATKKTVQDLKNTIIRQSGELRKCVYMSKEYQSSTQKYQLLANIFALYAILKATPTITDQAKSKSMKTTVTFRPHEIQVVTLFLLLGIVESSREQLSNRVAEVGTGEGKSIILGILSAYLALVGFNVRCACYSMYLSQRDQQNFKFLFDYLGISQKVKYGTFNAVCQEMLNPGDKDFKKEVYQMIMNSPKSWVNKVQKFFFGKTFNKKEQSISNNPTILLIDEVDVFFDSDFYGQCYRPSIKIKGQQITAFLKYVWQYTKQNSERRENIVEQIRKSPHFKVIIKKYENLQNVLENQLNAIILGAYEYKHDYFILQKKQKIVYKENDSINERLSYGYKTVFANLYQYERKKVSKTSLDEALAIELVVAEFSYSTLPKLFRHIIGVTGTIQSMPRFKKKILRQSYKVRNIYIVPSSFGLNEKKNHSFIQVNENNHYDKIIERIESIGHKRPIIVFFKNANTLYEFNNYQRYSHYNSRTLILTEEHDPSFRQRVVFMSTQANKITLMTKSFGRGTDFQVYDPNVNDNGGVHIIQTFLSLEQSEEIQIMGRTNRQNSNGSYEAIFKSNELSSLKLTQNLNLLNIKQISHHLLTARQNLAQQLNQDITLLAQISQQKHKKVIKVYSNKTLKQEELIQYVRQINECKKYTKQKVRTVIGIDGTYSMDSYLSKVISILKQTFERTYQILKKEKVDLNVQIMVVIYRNYNASPAQLLESTPFENNLDNLFNFLSKVRVTGGMGNEAIQVFFQTLNKLDEVSQAILIGDRGWNTREEVIDRRKRCQGEDVWIKEGFPLTFAGDQLEKIKFKKIPIHTFSIGKFASECFNNISRNTSGISQPWPQKTLNPSQILSHFISREIMKRGDEKLKSNGKLQKAYDKQYKQFKMHN